MFVADIKRAVSAHYGISEDDLLSDSRQRRLARPRQVGMYLARELTGKSLPEIGRMFCRHHATVHHASATIAFLRKRQPSLGADIFAILGRLPE